MNDPSTGRVRRTQLERRTATRGVLLQATVGCLVELGYQRTTTLEIERRAGVSRGARIHHFPTKAELLAAAVDHLYDRLAEHYGQAFGRPTTERSDADRLRSGLRLLWGVYRQPDYSAVLELMMAARTDEELRASLVLVSQRHRRLAVEAAAEYFPAVQGETAARLVEMINATMLGSLIRSGFEPSIEREQSILALLEELVVSHLLATAALPPR